MPAAPHPTQLQKVGDDRLRLVWDDGSEGTVTWKRLREECPCAGCKEERNQPPNPFRVLNPNELVAGPPRPISMSPVGHYAYKIVWNDGHDSGIYPLELLHRLSREAS